MNKFVLLTFGLLFVTLSSFSQETRKSLLQKAEAGDGDSQCLLGVRYYDGAEDTKVDYKKAFKWLKKAENTGVNEQKELFNVCMGHCYYMGNGTERNYKKALQYYQVAADMGNARAQNQVAGIYYLGKGIKENKALGAFWYEKAAIQGFSISQYVLGALYRDGDGVDQDYARALYWFQKAADQGHVEAMNAYGNMLFNGQGVEKNMDLAIYWWTKAAENGSANAKSNLNRFATNNNYNDVTESSQDDSESSGTSTVDALYQLGNALQSLGQSLGGGNVNGGAYQNTNMYNTNMNSGANNSSSSSKSKKCDECLGNGKCSGKGSSSKYHCHGSGKCYACNGKSHNGVGMHQTAGHYGDCDVCNNSGKCKYCDGNGKCKKCNGKGYL